MPDIVICAQNSLSHGMSILYHCSHQFGTIFNYLFFFLFFFFQSYSDMK